MTENRCPKLGEYECGMGHGYSCGSYNPIEDIGITLAHDDAKRNCATNKHRNCPKSPDFDKNTPKELEILVITG